MKVRENMGMLLLLVGALSPQLAAAQPATLKLSLTEAEQKAEAASFELKRAQAVIDSSNQQLSAQRATNLPRLTLDGSYRYISEVPEAKLGPVDVQFGQHNNYSIGPSLSYKIFDGGVDKKNTESVSHLVQARQHERSNLSLRLLMETRQAYAKVQGGIEELRLVDESLHLVQVRLKDIKRRIGAGSASKLEQLAGQREEQQLKLRYAQTQNNLAEAVRRLGTLTGNDQLPEPLIPVGRVARSASGIPVPNLILDLEGLETSLANQKSVVQQEAQISYEHHPGLQALSDLSDSAKLAAEGRDNESLPSVVAFAKASYDYPNGPLDEKVFQKMVGLSVSMTLYDGGIKRSLSSGKRSEALATELQRDQLQRDFQELWKNAKAGLYNLGEQKKIAASSITNAEQEARLTATNYAAGAATYLEVQRANNMVLEAKTTLLRLKSQELAVLATLNYLAADRDLKKLEAL